MRWKTLTDMEKQQQDQVELNIKEAQLLKWKWRWRQHATSIVMLMRQNLMRCQEEFLRKEELCNQELQKSKQLELSEEEKVRRH